MAQIEITNSLTPGTLLHSKTYIYTIEKVLGQGTFGITYLAKVELQGVQQTKRHSFHVTIKEFFMKEINGREETTVTSDAKGGICDKYKAKFAQEAKNLQKLNHPNIVSVIDFFAENNTYYYAMDYLCGGSLDSLIEKESVVCEEKALCYIGQIGRALSYMHSNKMLHLDLKPANVMLNADDEAVVIDFGLSKQYDENGEPESSTTIGGGTPGYAPIEQSAYHDGHDFPVTMDVYALGATLYKLLVGSRAPDASAILNDGFPVNLLRGHNVRQEIISIVSKAMSPMKKDRYQSVDAFLNDIVVPIIDEDDGSVIDVNKKDSKITRIASNKKRDTLADIIKAGDDAYNRKDFPTAVKHYVEAFRRDPSLGDIAYTIGEIMLRGHDDIANGDMGATRYQGDKLYRRWSKASEWFHKAYDLGIDTSEELLSNAEACFRKKDYKQYLKILQECIIKNYKCKKAYYLLIEAYEKGIGCKPEKVEWRLRGLREQLQSINLERNDINVLQQEETEINVSQSTNVIPIQNGNTKGCLNGIVMLLLTIFMTGFAICIC